jgi:hypothetical protein
MRPGVPDQTGQVVTTHLREVDLDDVGEGDQGVPVRAAVPVVRGHPVARCLERPDAGQDLVVQRYVLQHLDDHLVGDVGERDVAHEEGAGDVEEQRARAGDVAHTERAEDRADHLGGGGLVVRLAAQGVDGQLPEQQLERDHAPAAAWMP